MYNGQIYMGSHGRVNRFVQTGMIENKVLTCTHMHSHAFEMNQNDAIGNDM